MRTDVAEQLGHERLAKPHDLPVGFPLRIKIRATFAAAHRETRQRILKHLFECQELDDAGTDGWMKTQPTFVRAERAIHLHAKATVHLDLSFVVDPRNPKLNHSLWFHQTLKNSGVAAFLAALDDRPDGFQHFSDRLKKFRLVRTTFFNNFENF